MMTVLFNEFFERMWLVSFTVGWLRYFGSVIFPFHNGSFRS